MTYRGLDTRGLDTSCQFPNVIKRLKFCSVYLFQFLFNQEGTQLQSKMQDLHRQVECNVCNKSMRSNNLKRHKNTHKDLLSLPDNEIKDKLKSWQELKKKQEERYKKSWICKIRMT